MLYFSVLEKPVMAIARNANLEVPAYHLLSTAGDLRAHVSDALGGRWRDEHEVRGDHMAARPRRVDVFCTALRKLEPELYHET